MSSHLWSPSGSGNAAGVVEDIFQWFLSSKSVFSVLNQAKNRFSNILLLFLFLPLQGVRSTITNQNSENKAGRGVALWKISWNWYFFDHSMILHFYVFLCDFTFLICFFRMLSVRYKRMRASVLYPGRNVEVIYLITVFIFTWKAGTYFLSNWYVFYIADIYFWMVHETIYGIFTAHIMFNWSRMTIRILTYNFFLMIYRCVYLAKL